MYIRIKTYVIALFFVLIIYSEINFSAIPDSKYFLQAITDDHIEDVALMYKQSISTINQQDIEGNGPLHIACQTADSHKDARILWFLLDNYADANRVNNLEDTPIHDVIFISNVDKLLSYLNFLVKHGGNINARNISKQTLLDKAVRLHNLYVCDGILDWFGHIVTKDTVDKAKLLAGPQAGIGFGFTDIYEQLSTPHTAVFDQYGFHAKTGMTNIMYAVIRNDEKSIISLLEKKQFSLDAQSQDVWGYTALDIALMHQSKQMVKLLLAMGAHSGQKNKNNQNCLYRVLGIKDTQTRLFFADLIIKDNKIAINDKDVFGDTILHRALHAQDTALIEMLIGAYKKNIDTQVQDAHGITVLEKAYALDIPAIKQLFNVLANT